MTSIFLALVCAVPAWCQDHAPPAPQDGAADEVSYDFELPTRPRYALAAIPKPVMRRDFRVWLWLLDVSEEQAEKLDACFRAHENVQLAARRKLVKPLLDRSADIFASHPPGSLEGALLLAELLEDDRSALLRDLGRVDGSLFTAMSLHLSEEQRVRLEAVKSMRKRAVASNTRALYPGGDIDVLVMLHDVLRARDWPSITDDDGQFHALIASYGTEATPVFQRRCDSLLACRTEGSVLQKQYLSGRVNPEWAKRQRKQLRTKYVASERRIHDINRRYIEQFGQLLDDETRELLQDAWSVAVYEPVYPDPTDTSSLFQTALEIEGLDEKEREQVRELATATTADHELLNALMVKRLLDYREEQGIEWRYGEIYDQYEEDILRLHERRMNLAKQEIEWLRATVNANVWKELEDDAARLVREMERFELIPDRRRWVPE